MTNFNYIGEIYTANCIRARQFEKEGNWEEALKLRKALGHKTDAEAIELIIKANSLGNQFREKAKDVIKDWEDRKINSYQMHQKLSEASREVYNK